MSTPTEKKQNLVEVAMDALLLAYDEIMLDLQGKNPSFRGYDAKDKIAAVDRLGSNLFRVHQMFPGGFGPKSLKDLAKIIHLFVGDDEKKLDKLIIHLEDLRVKRNVNDVSSDKVERDSQAVEHTES